MWQKKEKTLRGSIFPLLNNGSFMCPPSLHLSLFLFDGGPAGGWAIFFLHTVGWRQRVKVHQVSALPMCCVTLGPPSPPLASAFFFVQ